MSRKVFLSIVIAVAAASCGNEQLTDNGTPYSEYVERTCDQIGRGRSGPPDKIIARNAKRLTNAEISRGEFEGDVVSNCESVVKDAKAGKTQSSTYSERRRYDLETDECKRSGGTFAFTGRLRNESPATESYRLDVEVVDSDRALLGRDRIMVHAVPPGRKVTWMASGQLMGTPRGSISCRVEDVRLAVRPYE